MRMKLFTLWIAFLTLISLVVLVYILTNIDPYDTTILSFILFYLSFFVALAGLLTLVVPKISFRRGILISIILTGFLLLWTLIK